MSICLERYQLALAPLGGLAGHSLERLGQAFLQLFVGGKHQHHTVAFLEHDALAFGRRNEGIVAQAVHRQLDLAKLEFELATFATGQHGRAKMIAHLEFQARFVIHHHRRFGIDFSDVDAFRRLLSDVNETGLKLLDQLCAQITQHEQCVHIQITDCQGNAPTSKKAPSAGAGSTKKRPSRHAYATHIEKTEEDCAVAHCSRHRHSG